MVRINVAQKCGSHDLSSVNHNNKHHHLKPQRGMKCVFLMPGDVWSKLETIDSAGDGSRIKLRQWPVCPNTPWMATVRASWT